MARVRRITILAAVYLLLGSVVSVAVAWGFAAQFPWTYWGVETGVTSEVEAFDRPIPEWAMKEIGSPTLIPNRYVRRKVFAVGVTIDEVSGWHQSPGTPIPELPFRSTDSYPELSNQAVHFGWPVRMLERRQYRLTTDPMIETNPPTLPFKKWKEPELAYDGWHAFDRQNGRSAYPVRLPVQPLWLGMAANSIFYGAIIAALVATPGLIRRAIRAKRVRAGLCPSCRYPRGVAAVCSECGEKLGQELSQVNS